MFCCFNINMKPKLAMPKKSSYVEMQAKYKEAAKAEMIPSINLKMYKIKV